MIRYKTIGFAWLLFSVFGVLAGENLEQTAEQQYSEQNWQQAVKSYQKLLKSQPDNEQFWFRLAQSYLQLKQGKKALKANKKLDQPQQIPPGLVAYQKAQALALMDENGLMWQALEQAVQTGFRNLNDLQNNEIWNKHREQQPFKQIMTSVDQTIRPCIYDEVYQHFDFWLGNWEVYGNINKTGPLAGHNTITKTEQGCLIMEQWKGASGSTGTSMNYYDGLQQKWVQRWVSSGISIDYAGGLISNEKGQKVMRLEGKIYYASQQQQPQIRDFRGTWTPLDGGVVQQFFEESIDGGKTWYSWFNGFYFPVDKESESDE
ncbi:MAG: tetratricopeptide repeat protein [Marinicella sp.]